MVPVYICDDESKICQHIAKLVENRITIMNYDMGPIFTANSPQELLNKTKQGERPAIYFLDVDLQQDLDGFILAAEIRKFDPQGYIIFITGHGELSAETFRYRLEALDYIVKGEEENLRNRLFGCLQSIQQRLQSQQASVSEYYTIKIFDTVRHIPSHTILYFEANGKQHRINLHTENEILEFFGSLQKIEDELGKEYFRSHRGFLVNRARIKGINLKESLVHLDTGDTCPLSRNAKKALQEIF